MPHAAASANSPSAISWKAMGRRSTVSPSCFSASFMSESLVMDGRIAADSGVTYAPESFRMPTKLDVENSST